MEPVDAAEKEASEVLHKLLSVERIEKPNYLTEHNQVVVVVTCAGASTPSSTETQQQSVCQEVQNGSGTVQWCTPVTLHHSLFSSITGDDEDADYQNNQVIWEGDAAELGSQNPGQKTRARSCSSSDREQADKAEDSGTSRPEKVVKRPKKFALIPGSELNQLEDNVLQVRERLERCCECQEQNCFKGLNPESVYRHRLNIAELTKEEHDMYLMGVTMAVLTNPELTVRHKERRRLRSQYVFQGRRVCLDAFLYLENCTHYHLKRIRKHVMTRGVSPRIHGNHGKKPHNTFSLDIYRHATMFLKHFIKSHTTSSTLQTATQSTPSTQATEKQKTVSRTPPLYLPPEVTRKTIHNAYREYCELFEPTIKVMGYSTFRHFMKEQFPHVKFCKIETTKPPGQSNVAAGSGKANPDGEHNKVSQGSKPVDSKEAGDSAEDSEGVCQDSEKVDIKVESFETLPVVYTDGNTVPQEKQTTFIVAPVSQIIQGPSIVASTEGYPSYQLATAPANCFSSQTEVETITVTPVIGTPLTTAYSFTTL